MISPQIGSRIMLDTMVVSYVFNKHTQAEFFKSYLNQKTLAVSFMTVGELYYGAYHANWGQNQITKLENHLKNYVVLPFDYEVCQKWAEIKHQCENDGLRIEDADCWIAACALKYECHLATNNANHFKRIKNLNLIAPGLM